MHKTPEFITETFGVAIKLHRFIYWGRSLRISAETPGILTEGFHAFPQFPQVNTMIVPRLGHLRFLHIFSNSSFIYHTVRRYVIYYIYLRRRVITQQKSLSCFLLRVWDVVLLLREELRLSLFEMRLKVKLSV
jgi:hypothetical protein